MWTHVHTRLCLISRRNTSLPVPGWRRQDQERLVFWLQSSSTGDCIYRWWHVLCLVIKRYTQSNGCIFIVCKEKKLSRIKCWTCKRARGVRFPGKPERMFRMGQHWCCKIPQTDRGPYRTPGLTRGSATEAQAVVLPIIITIILFTIIQHSLTIRTQYLGARLVEDLSRNKSQQRKYI